MTEKRRRYANDTIEVSFNPRRCIHSAECVQRLPQVFDTDRTPWIDPDGADADRIADAIHHCPTGALRYRRLDQGVEEQPQKESTARMIPCGPLHLRGDIRVYDETGELLVHDTRVALCRCGFSENMPFCDNSHDRMEFIAPGELHEATDQARPATPTHVQIRETVDGPLVFQGSLTVIDSHGQWCCKDKGALCRCGQSRNKPFCDGSHTRVGFSTGG